MHAYVLFASSVSSGGSCFAGGRCTSVEAISFDSSRWLIKGYNPQCGFGLLLDSQLCCTVLGPFHPYKAPLFGNNPFELLITVGIMGVSFSEFFSSLETRLLYFFYHPSQATFQSFSGLRFL